MSQLAKRKLGRTVLEVTALSFGAMELRGPRVWNGPAITDQEAERILHAVLDAGINFIDTSNDYGRSEELIGRYVSHRRSEFFLATKCGCHLVNAGDRDETKHEWTRQNILRGIDESLSRLKTDYVDLLQFHNASVNEVQENNLIQVLKELQSAGKVRFLGASTTLPHLPTFLEMGAFDTFQIPYSALDREHEGWIAKSHRAGIGTIIRGGVARGAPAGDRRLADKLQAWEKAKLDDLLDGMSKMEFILRFTLSHPGLHTTIVGTRSLQHLQDNLKASAKGPLPPNLYAEAQRRLDAAGEKPT